MHNKSKETNLSFWMLNPRTHTESETPKTHPACSAGSREGGNNERQCCSRLAETREQKR